MLPKMQSDAPKSSLSSHMLEDLWLLQFDISKVTQAKHGWSIQTAQHRGNMGKCSTAAAVMLISGSDEEALSSAVNAPQARGRPGAFVCSQLKRAIIG